MEQPPAVWKQLRKAAQKVSISVLLVVTPVFVSAKWFELWAKADISSVVRSGVPFAQLRNQGFEPQDEYLITYLDQPMRLYCFRSSGLFGAKAIDFVAIVNAMNVVEVCFRISSEADREFVEDEFSVRL